MNDRIADGEPHAIDHKYGYISREVTDKLVIEYPTFDDFVEPLVFKYAEYVCGNKNCKQYDDLVKKIMSEVFRADEDYTIIYRPPFADHKASVAIRFRRLPNDNLERRYEHV